MSLLVVLVCVAATGKCDRLTKEVDNCIMAARDAQVMLAQTKLAEGATVKKIDCKP